MTRRRADRLPPEAGRRRSADQTRTPWFVDVFRDAMNSPALPRAAEAREHTLSPPPASLAARRRNPTIASGCTCAIYHGTAGAGRTRNGNVASHVSRTEGEGG